MKNLLVHTRAAKQGISSIWIPALVGVLALSACASEDSAPADEVPEITNEDGDAPLSDVDALFLHAPPQSSLPEEGKADAVYPALHTELLAVQSPVKSQGSRGVCSIFSTTALMEHLYISEGTVTDPDFSEQYLQWAVKVLVGAFTNTEGSSDPNNIAAINQHGIPVESAWPYVTTQWTTTDDPACTGETRPVQCWTNGSPPAEAESAQKFMLPRGRWVNASRRSIKAFMTANKQGVLSGLDFFYQSWNHRRSTLPTDNTLWRKGVVTYPNADDERISLEKRAGHSVLLAGWDDDYEAPKRDGEGNPVLNADGTTQMEKGFWIFKNSWGTASFGVENPYGNGYGYLSMAYVERFGTIYGAGLPDLSRAREICDDTEDNDFDRKIDCDDSDCSAEPACMDATPTIYESNVSGDIPETTEGLSSDIEISDEGVVEGLMIRVDITHPAGGDLTLRLQKLLGGEVMLQEADFSEAAFAPRSYTVVDFNGQDLRGTWRLIATDVSPDYTGTLNSWSIELTH